MPNLPRRRLLRGGMAASLLLGATGSLSLAAAVMQPRYRAPGIQIYQEVSTWAGQSLPITIVAVQLQAAGLVMRPVWASSDQLPGLQPLPDISTRLGSVAAINGGFFNRNTQQPLGAIRLDNQWISSPILGRAAIGWNDQGEIRLQRVQANGEISTPMGDRLPLLGTNTGYVVAGLSQYTRIWGSTYTSQTDQEIILVVVGGRISAIQFAGGAGSQQVGIPAQGYLLVGREEAGRLDAQRLVVGDEIRVHWQVNPPEMARFPHLLGAGPLLLAEGQIVLDAELERFQPSFRTQRAARSALGWQGSDHILWVTAGQAQEQTGLTLQEMATLMQHLGCQAALNLDGGNSSTLVYQGKVLNQPQAEGEVRMIRPRVHNGLGLFRP
ncbi:MAG: phosphodiester glycosidase family protein [Cyanobacteriota bacterium]|nr:phosphodiester glycosidase family protein [Cyanobacteriota bacterium]